MPTPASPPDPMPRLPATAAPRPPLDPCQRRTRFGPIQPMAQGPSFLRWLLFG